MAHYRGWTIVVSLDSIDEDWSAQATQGLYFNLPQLIQANSQANAQHFILGEWLATKEEAFAAIISKIDQFIAQG
ncbi:MAG: hypothetical protein HXY43_04350 [Fischerella sp.]|jgi:hypothetical protein|uniref:hypothetical protein n=1 Tax=Fischerella sp. TaxID=1191 RepID=UPI00183DEAC3|nr:hypothetical protein [Fischerella sp.]NWF58545.1 hypothetical protein [Fischerella sp.]